MPERSQTLNVWRREGFFFYFYGFIAKHLFVFTSVVTQFHAFDNRRPNQDSDLTIGPCDILRYARARYSYRYEVWFFST